MTERLLQYIWQFGYFNKLGLHTTTGEPIEILFPGKLNTNQGPDFLDARIKLGQTIFAGSVELHLKTSQWNTHGHQHDANYKNVVLHVVYENDLPSGDLPVLELQSLIPKVLLERYGYLMNAASFIPCAASISGVKDITWAAWKERVLVERLTRKSEIILEYVKNSKHHWEEAFWWALAKNFGGKVNGEALEAMARAIPINLLAKHKHQIHQIEALLFGQAGLLANDFVEEYPKMLKREYVFLQKKYNLTPTALAIHFLRMRPVNFPTVRLAQLAALIQKSEHLFSKILELETVAQIKALLKVTANDYWHYHYRFEEASAFKKKTLGEDMINNICINTIVPVVFAYGIFHKADAFKTKALRWLEEISAEQNVITKGFTTLNISNKTAYDSQALLELKNEYCSAKRCLQCAVGSAILKTS